MKFSKHQNKEALLKLDDDWELIPFQELIDSDSGGKHKIKKKDYLKTGKYPIVDQGEKFIGGYTNDSEKLIDGPFPKIIFGDHTRRFKFVDFPFGVGADGTKILTPKKKCHVKYFYYYFKSIINLPDTGYNRHFKYLKRFIIPVPPLETQKKIASVLDNADALRKKRQQTIGKLDELTKSLFLDMFGDPVLNPKNWPVHKLANLGTLERGKSKHRPRNAPELLGGPYPLIQTGDVSNSGGYITKYNSTYSELGLKQSKMWKEGTLCITIAANIANTGILTFDACFPDSVVGFKPNEKSNVEYIQGIFFFLQKILEETAPQVAQKNINLKILRDLEVPIPPIEDQIKFAELNNVILKTKNKSIKHLDHLDKLFNSLIQKAFKGELKFNMTNESNVGTELENEFFNLN